jgi:hypothetical protein
MSFDKIFEAYKEAILSSVDKRDYDKVEILNNSMKLLNESLIVNPITKPVLQPVDEDTIPNSPATTAIEIEDFVVNLLYKRGRVKSSEAINMFYKHFESRFTSYDYGLNSKGDPRWKCRFWNVTSNLRKSGVLMPNKGRHINYYALNINHKVAEN